MQNVNTYPKSGVILSQQKNAIEEIWGMLYTVQFPRYVGTKHEQNACHDRGPVPRVRCILLSVFVINCKGGGGKEWGQYNVWGVGVCRFFWCDQLFCENCLPVVWSQSIREFIMAPHELNMFSRSNCVKVLGSPLMYRLAPLMLSLLGLAQDTYKTRNKT